MKRVIAILLFIIPAVSSAAQIHKIIRCDFDNLFECQTDMDRRSKEGYKLLDATRLNESSIAYLFVKENFSASNK